MRQRRWSRREGFEREVAILTFDSDDLPFLQTSSGSWVVHQW